MTRWIIATLTSIAVIALIYHNAVPRTQPWHSVLPGATLATALWFLATTLFSMYLHSYADYSIIYGSLGVGYRPAGVDVHDLAHRADWRRIQCHAISARVPGEGTAGVERDAACTDALRRAHTRPIF